MSISVAYSLAKSKLMPYFAIEIPVRRWTTSATNHLTRCHYGEFA